MINMQLGMPSVFFMIEDYIIENHPEGTMVKSGIFNSTLYDVLPLIDICPLRSKEHRNQTDDNPDEGMNYPFSAQE